VPADVAPVVRFAVTDDVTTDDGPRLQRAFVRVVTPDSMTEVNASFIGGDLFRAELPAQPDGTEVSYTACAIDIRGNEGCAETRMYVIPASGSSSSGMGGSSSSSSGSGSGGGTPGGPVIIDDGGCGCAVPGTSGRAAGALALSALAAALAWRRRRAGSRAAW
jgi:MYXO-CTERM domain-containing protein